MVKKRCDKVDHFCEILKASLKSELPSCRIVDKIEGNNIDLAIVVGGDGTLLKVSNMFKTQVPPVLPFAMGSLNFLPSNSVEQVGKTIRNVLNEKCSILFRSRIEATLNGESRVCLNEFLVHRVQHDTIAKIDVRLDEQLFTCAIADGMIVSTPTGSTAYSLSAGGSIIHPSLKSTIITPICPRSLSFRPIVLPSSISISMSLNEANRAAVAVSSDGIFWRNLLIRDSLVMKESKYSMPVIITNREKHEWINRINNVLNWNHPFKKD